ncbi:MAG: hypothetical protein H0V01_01110 [Bacteroidetes bacterium]|nr:hypothetical protein [Bacteroidota bacterium]HET6244768.1 hypothetical protein [Bacteroidia bacterium]
MKTVFNLLLLILLFTVYSAKAQQEQQRSAYDKGDILLSAGVSLGAFGVDRSFRRISTESRGTFVPFFLNAEYVFHPSFSAGPYMAYYGYGYNYSIANVDLFRHTNSFAFGARGSWHFLEMLNEVLDTEVDATRWDFYATLHLGFQVNTLTTDDIPSRRNGGPNTKITTSNTRLNLAPVIGARYMVNERLGFMAEIGRGPLAFSSLGLTFKL